MDEVLAILDTRIAEIEALYRSSKDDETELYLQGCLEEAKRLAETIRALG